MTSGPSSSANINHVEIDTVKSSKISHISLYFGRAEITRHYKFSVAQGANKLVISNLPDVLQNDTLRVKGKGAGVIHDVSVSNAQPTKPTTTSEPLVCLLSKKEELEGAVGRCKKCLHGLECYIATLDTRHVDMSKLTEIVENYEVATAKFDARAAALVKDLENVKTDIVLEETRLRGLGVTDTKLRKVANIVFVAEEHGPVELELTYVVTYASWYATYDIRASTGSTEEPLQLFYKAVIVQHTGENWADIPLTLETASPTYGVSLPDLPLWKLSVYKPPVNEPRTKETPRRATFMDAEAEVEESDDDMGFGLFDDGPETPLEHALAQVTSKGDVNATYRIPGLITVPSDGDAHTVTIRNLDLPVNLSWVSIPKKDTKVHLTAKIDNNSDYTFIAGKANVYLDGSFISSINLPLVSPKETFNCPLGLDQSVRVAYHPGISKVTASGFLMRTSNTLFSQRITVQNTKSTAIGELTIIDHIPVSEDHQVTVSLKSPALRVPDPEDLANYTPLHDLGNGIKAYWHESGENGDLEHLGKDGKLKWVCSMPANSKLNLLLQWEVSASSQVVVLGLKG